MRRRPWPIVILALVNLTMPLVNMIISAAILKLPVFQYASMLFSRHPDRAVHMFAPLMLSAFAIYSFRRWSYGLLFFCMGWLLWRNIFNFSNFNIFSIWVLLPAVLINLGVVSYFLFLPSVRAPYFDSRLRWWETKPRFKASAPIKMSLSDEQRDWDAEMTDISEGGVFLTTLHNFDLDQTVALNFKLEDLEVAGGAKVVWARSQGSRQGYGLQFNDSPQLAKTMAVLAKRLRERGYAETRPVGDWRMDFRNWFHTLLKTGKGLTPELPQGYKPPDTKE